VGTTADQAICAINEVVATSKAIRVTNEVEANHHVRKRITTLGNTIAEGDRHKRWGDWNYILHPLT